MSNFQVTIEADDMTASLVADIKLAANLYASLEKVADHLRALLSERFWVVTVGGHHVAISYKFPSVKRVALIAEAQ